MPIINLEGLDGSGKSTQYQLLFGCLQRHGYEVVGMHFPRLEDKFYGELIATYLRGGYGPKESHAPQLVSLMYAEDRRDASPRLREWLADGKFVLLDRYYHSNVAYQAARMEDKASQDTLIQWILELELTKMMIPDSDCTIFLNTPRSFLEETFFKRKGQSHRDYLQGNSDIYESDIEYQMRVQDQFLRMRNWENYHIVECMDESDKMMPPDSIHSRLWEVISKRFDLKD